MFLEENVVSLNYKLSVGNTFLDWTQKALNIRERIDKMDFKIFCS